jgi:diamine N-acetyltransferase
MIDVADQRRGIGQEAVALVAAELQDAGWDCVETSFVPTADGAGEFWRRCGFECTDQKRNGEPVMVLRL